MRARLDPIISCCLLLCYLTSGQLYADYTLKEGWFINANAAATLPVQEHYTLGAQAVEQENWVEAARQFNIVTLNFPQTPYGQEAYFYLGVAYYYLEEYDFANDSFSQYLKSQSHPRLFQEAVEYKYQIAENLKNGARRRFFGTKRLPKWAPGTSLALTIYDEVIAVMPCHEIAAKALISKGFIHWDYKNYRQAVDALQQVIRRFPKHELVPDCYVYISQIYLEQSKYEFQNSDILAFAQINLRKFKQEFPRDPGFEEAQNNLQAIQEVYACGLYGTGQFYERTQKPSAAVLYYLNAIKQFPDTEVATLCRQRICALNPKALATESLVKPDQGPSEDFEDIDLKPFEEN